MLCLQSLTLGYGPRRVLEGVSLTVSPGEIVALVGPNGSGKSTLLRAASGVLAPVAGSVQLDGAALHALAPADRARRVAVVPQAARLPDAFTVEDTVLLGRTAYVGWVGRETAADRDAAQRAMARAGIEGLSTRRLGEISGGEQQLVLLARALAQSAPVMLLDEPTAHLDLGHEMRILTLLEHLAREEKLAVLIALHDLNIAAQFAHRVALLAGGGLRALGPPNEVLTVERIRAAYGVDVAIRRLPETGGLWIVAERPG